MKILVCGDVEGKFEGIFARAAKLDASNGPFHALFCCGRFFGAATEAVPAAAIPTYFFENEGAPVTYLGAAGIRGIRPLNDETSPRQLTVAYVAEAAGATGARKLKHATADPGYLGADLLLSTEWPKGIDVGVEDSVHRTVAQKTGVYIQAVGTGDVAEALGAVRPRYHFAAKHGAFWARAPFRLSRLPPTTPRTYISRFVALGSAAEASKDKAKKWLHAIDIEPTPFASLETLTAEPSDLTASPFKVESAASAGFADLDAMDRKRSAAQAFEETTHKDQIVWGADESVAGTSNNSRNKRPARPVDPTSRTLFVGGVAYASTGEALTKLVNEALAAGDAPVGLDDVRMAGASGGGGGGGGEKKGFAFLDFATRADAERALATLAEGRLELDGRRLHVDWGSVPAGSKKATHTVPDRPDCWFCLASPGCETHLIAAVGTSLYVAQPKGALADAHALVVPIAHASRLGGDLDAAAHAELEEYTKALAECFRKKLSASTLAFERYADVRGQFHAHRQVVPVENVRGADLLTKLREKARAAGFDLFDADATAPFAPHDETAHYFVTDVFDGATGKRTRLVHVAQGHGRLRVPLQFGREVAAEAMGAPERSDWKMCAQPKEEETALCSSFKALFEPFDPAKKAEAKAA